jgi:hypothetical protein
MKYLAILKDSLREALDTKVIYFTLGLSGLFLVLVASLSFRPVPAEEQFRRSTEFLTRMLGRFTQGKGPRFAIEDFSSSNPDAPAWQQDYRFAYVIEFQDENAVEQLRKEKENPLAGHRLAEQLKAEFPWIEQVEVREVASENPKEIRSLVQTKGTAVEDRRAWVYEPSLFFGALPLSFLQMSLAKIVEFITDDLIGTWGAGITMLLSTIITAFFIPNMLRKGTVDMLLAKPIHRTTLLIYKYIGGLTFMFLNTLVIVVGVWLILGVRTGVWLPRFPLSLFIFTFQFAIFYSVSTLMAVLTRSPIVAILATVAFWAILFGIGFGYRIVDNLRPERIAELPEQQQEVMPKLPSWVFVVSDVLHFVTPHYKDLDVLTTKLIRHDLMDADNPRLKEVDKQARSVNWTESLTVTIGYIVFFVGLSCIWFATRDY